MSKQQTKTEKRLNRLLYLKNANNRGSQILLIDDDQSLGGDLLAQRAITHIVLHYSDGSQWSLPLSLLKSINIINETDSGDVEKFKTATGDYLRRITDISEQAWREVVEEEEGAGAIKDNIERMKQ